MIKGLSFTVFSREDIRNKSVASINTHKTSVLGSVNDLRMGTCSSFFKCDTCGSDAAVCPGHFGHIELCFPVYNILFIGTVVKILNSVCTFCSSLLLTNINKGRPSPLLFKRIAARSRSITTCKVCNSPTGLYTKKRVTIERKWPVKTFIDSEQMEAASRMFTAADAFVILQGISDKSLKLLGIGTRPENFISHNVIVPPNMCRPSVQRSVGSKAKGDDDLTLLLVNVIKRNTKLLEYINNNNSMGEFSMIESDEFNDLLSKLAYAVASIVRNDIAGKAPVMHRNGTTLKDVATRIKGKDGRLRKNLMGKRVEGSARAVITPGGDIDVEEVGVPKVLAMKLYIDVAVNFLNLRTLQERVERGPFHINGAVELITPTGEIIDLAMIWNPKKKMYTRTINLQPHWKVKRPLQNGDWVVINRHPSLHKKSLMGHRVVLIPGNTVQLNLSVAEAYNADFDGDEMNIHVPRNIKIVQEIQDLLAVRHQIMNAATSKPVIGTIFDALLGAYLLTSNSVFLRSHEVMELITQLKHDCNLDLPLPAILKPEPLWTGKQVLSLLLPSVISGVWFTRNSTSEDSCLDPEQRVVVIRRGYICSGRVNKDVVGKKKSSLIQKMVFACGSETTEHFMSDIQRLVNHWLTYTRGFSTSVGDLRLSAPDKQVIDTYLAKEITALENVLRVDDNVNYSDRESLVCGFINKLMLNVNSNVACHLAGRCDNSIKDMAQAGSKGNEMNHTQMIAMVGQQIVTGGRPMMNDGATIHQVQFGLNDSNLKAHGYIRNSFLNGLDPLEMFFHAMSGREGLVDTAVKTATSGYLHRKIMQALISVTTNFDGTLRDVDGNIMSYNYWNDGFDGSMVISRNYNEIYESMISLYNNIKDSRFCVYVKLISACIDELASFVENDLLQCASNAIYVPAFLLDINIDIIIGKKEDDGGRHVTEADITSWLKYVRKTFLSDMSNATMFLIASYSNPLCLIDDKQLSSKGFKRFRDHFESKLFYTIIQPGEMVGSLAAQSCAEPATQMTLNTFHTAGRESKSVNIGVPRMKELLSLSRSIISKQLYSLAPVEKTPTLAELQKYVYVNVKDSINAVRMSDDYYYTNEEHWHIFLSLYIRFYEDKSTWVHSFIASDEYQMTSLIPVTTFIVSISACFMELLPIFLEYAGSRQMMMVPSSPCATDPVFVLHSHMRLSEIDRMHIYYELDQVIKNTRLSGFENVKDVSISPLNHPRRNKKNGHLETEPWSMVTIFDGDLVQFMKVGTILDPRTLWSNNVMEVYEQLGIEIATLVLFSELKKIYTSEGSTVTDRHIMILVDSVMRTGVPIAFDRHGFKKSERDVLIRATFESSLDVLQEAAVFEKRDNLLSVAGRVIVGRNMRGGTGFPDIVDNMSFTQNTSTNIVGSSVHNDVEAKWITQGVLSTCNQLRHIFRVQNKVHIHASNKEIPIFEFNRDSLLVGDTSDKFQPTEYSEVSHYTENLYGHEDYKIRQYPSSPTFGLLRENDELIENQPSSPSYQLISPTYGPMSPSYDQNSPIYNPISPTYDPDSPIYNPVSPKYSPS